jgi:protein-L-isoaspartate(D-aspartate) O-methyltransferase
MSHADLDEIRTFFAKLMAAASGSADPRCERIFELVPREAFMGPGPWKIRAGRQYIETPSDDPSYLYQNVLVALDSARQINNGEPFLHARWIGLADPQPAETVTHIGAGTGYYSALLSMLVLPDGRVDAFEIDKNLARAAKNNLKPFENVSVIFGDATASDLPPSDLIYVNAGVVEPPERWLDALKPGGRMIFPWCPAQRAGVAVLVTRTKCGFSAKPLMPVWFILCVGASESAKGSIAPTMENAWKLGSVHKTKMRQPDDTALAIGENIWFSSAKVSH